MLKRDALPLAAERVVMAPGTTSNRAARIATRRDDRRDGVSAHALSVDARHPKPGAASSPGSPFAGLCAPLAVEQAGVLVSGPPTRGLGGADLGGAAFSLTLGVCSVCGFFESVEGSNHPPPYRGVEKCDWWRVIAV